MMTKIGSGLFQAISRILFDIRNKWNIIDIYSTLMHWHILCLVWSCLICFRAVYVIVYLTLGIVFVVDTHCTDYSDGT